MKETLDLSNLFSYIYDHPRKCTYIAIGCANHRYPNQVPPPQDRQQYPKFFEELTKDLKSQARILLIDPYLESPPTLFFLFSQIYEVAPYENLYQCEPNGVEIILIRQSFEFLNQREKTFLELLNLHTI